MSMIVSNTPSIAVTEMLLRLLTARRRFASLILLCAILASCGLVLLLLPATSTRWIQGSDLHYQVALEMPQFFGNASTLQSTLGLAVPHIVHQSWKSRKLPTARTERWSASWSACLPGWERRLWTDDDNLELIRRHYNWFLPVYLGYKKPIERADLARYFYMHRYGGVYADLDAMCLRNFTHLLQPPAAVIFSGMAYDQGRKHELVQGTYVQNSFMASRPGHPFWLRLAERAMRLFHQHHGLSSDTRPEYLTGPFLLMDALRELYKEEGGHSDVVIYPGKYFNPFSWSVNKNPACKHLGGMTDADERACVASFPEAYVVQFHTQSWLKGRL